MQKALEEAAAWYARLQAPDCGPEDQAHFQQWLQQHPDHAAAYASAEQLVRNLVVRASQDDHLRALTEQALAMGAAVPEISPSARILQGRWRQWQPLAAAASIVLAVFLALTLPDFIASRNATHAYYEAPLSAQRAVTLNDGTLTNLDIDSAVTVAMTANARDISLVRGRALFDVAHDAQRPFSVSIGSTRVIALGTRFQVQRQDNAVIVTLEEGSIDVVGDFEGQPLRDRLSPGEQLRFEQGSSQWRKTTVETESVTSWSRARHVFRNSALGFALDEVNRYATVKIRLGDPALADLTVSGNFLLGESDLIAAAFEAALPVRVVTSGRELILFPVYDDDSQQAPDRPQ